MFNLRILLVICLLVSGSVYATPVLGPMLKALSDYGEKSGPQATGMGSAMEKRRWLFPTQKSMSPLYPTTDCTEDLGSMINQFRRMPRGKDRDAMIAAIYTYCANKGV